MSGFHRMQRTQRKKIRNDRPYSRVSAVVIRRVHNDVTELN